ncbi:hypothetical protein ERO13_A10G182200v2 [Gossypium hirsutum]|uniref:Uncharacterized protein n=2 Tax=Gossypium TaxID=3633 RepID=A0A5D2XPY4_GOSMU|nr:hypothetical protein ERO13_A10G182200v2 [Gossypium hirsutum]TYI07279.1 hypothetical protein ES332_A10G217500v1 [Gossypium tomentosum]TYJ15690.1 hypothetical protein E1A91_A10G200800v1 [Gossypium mustelinum]
MEFIEVALTDSLMKMLMFLIVQALVYLILSKSSHVFSNNKMMTSSLSFKAARSLCFWRILASMSDFPQVFEQPSPSSKSLRSAVEEYPEEYKTY